MLTIQPCDFTSFPPSTSQGVFASPCDVIKGELPMTDKAKRVLLCPPSCSLLPPQWWQITPQQFLVIRSSKFENVHTQFRVTQNNNQKNNAKMTVIPCHDDFMVRPTLCTNPTWHLKCIATCALSHYWNFFLPDSS